MMLIADGDESSKLIQSFVVDRRGKSLFLSLSTTKA